MSSTEGASSKVRWRPRAISAHCSRGLWPHRSSNEGASGRVRMAASGYFGTPITRIVAPQRTLPNTPVAGFVWRPRAITAHPSRG
eukprot:3042994-Pyramimonas_sp.AAC.1